TDDEPLGQPVERPRSAGNGNDWSNHQNLRLTCLPARFAALKVDIERVEHACHFGKQLVVVLNARAGTGQHGLETSRLGGGFAADVETVNHFADAQQRCIFLQAEGMQQNLETHLVVDVGEGGAVEIEAEGVLRYAPDVGKPNEGRVFVDESLNEPGARDAVDPGTAPRCPAPPLVIAA